MNLETYLGDGLYASMECDMVKLRAPRDYEDHEVFLENEVLMNFFRFVEKQFNVTITITKNEQPK